MSAKNDCENMDEYYNIQIEYLKKIKTSLNKANELQGIIESMIADIQQFLYLIRLE
jgi:ribosomal protein L17